MAYTTLEKVKARLQVDAGKIKVSEQELVPGQKEEVSVATIEQLITDIDAKINVELENKGITASNYLNALSYIATLYVAYEVYGIVYPRVGANEKPKTISDWKKDADDLLGKIGKGKFIGAQFGAWEP